MNLTGGGNSRLWIGGDDTATVNLGGNNSSTYSDTNSTIIGHSTTGTAGTVKLLSATALGPNSQQTQVHSGTLDLNGQTGVTVGNISLSNTSHLVNNNADTAASFGGTVNLDGVTTHNIGGAGSMTLSGVLSNGGFTKTGSGMLTLTDTNTYTGATSVTEGTLKVTGSIGSSAVTVSGTGTVLASGTSGTIGKGVTIQNGAILAAGGQNTVGTATVGSDGLSFASGSIFEWDLATSKDANGAAGDDGVGGTDFDSVSVTGNLTADATGAIFKVIFGTAALTDITTPGNTFWNTAYGTQTWNMTTIFGKSFTTNAFTSVETSANVSAYGSFTITGSSLTWTAVPEPTSALAGLLITAGLLRRRRA